MENKSDVGFMSRGIKGRPSGNQSWKDQLKKGSQTHRKGEGRRTNIGVGIWKNTKNNVSWRLGQAFNYKN